MDLVQHIKPIIDWLHFHPGYAGVFTFLISFAESLAILGLIVPGSVVMSAVGTLVGAGIIPAYETMGWAALGAIVGDILSFKVGYYYTDQIKEIWPFRKYPQMIASAEDFFDRHGGKSIFLGRFVGPMRPIVPLVAGMMRMNKIRFYIPCVIAGILWAPAYMLPGMFIGAASQQLAPETATRFLITVLIVLTFIWLTAWFFKWLISKVIDVADKGMDIVWHYLKNHRNTRWICILLQDPLNPKGHGQLTMAIVAVIFIGLFISIYYSTLHHGFFTLLNQPVHQLCRNIHSAFMTKVMILITFVGYKYVVGFVSLAVFSWLVLKKNYRAAIHWLFVSVTVVFSVLLLKHFIYSPRPGGLLDASSVDSFPSGHTTLSVAIYGFFAFLIARNFSHASQRKYIYSFFIALCLLIMTSRVYLGAHWLTDVLAGSLLGLIIVFLAVISFKRAISPKLKLKGLITVAFLTLLACMPWQITHNYSEMLQIYTPYWPSYSANLDSWWHQPNDNTPLYRPNRIGQPVEFMNVQWVSSLSTIQNNLQKEGWKIIPKMSLIDLINRVASYNDEDHLPILAPLYLGKPPILTAVKYSSENRILILHLWASNIEFTDSNLPLWVGTLTYQLPRSHKFWLHKKYLQNLKEFDAPPDELKPFLRGFKYHTLKYDADKKPPHIPAYEWQGGVIFVMPNSR